MRLNNTQIQNVYIASNVKQWGTCLDKRTLNANTINHSCLSTSGLPLPITRPFFIEAEIYYTIQYALASSYRDALSWKPNDTWYDLNSSQLVFSEVDQNTMQTNISLSSFDSVFNGSRWLKFRIIPFADGRQVGPPSRPSSPVMYIKNYPDINNNNVVIKQLYPGYLHFNIPYNNPDDVPVRDYRIEYSTNNGNTWILTPDENKSIFLKDSTPFPLQTRYETLE